MKYCPITPTANLGQIAGEGYFCFAELALQSQSYTTHHRAMVSLGHPVIMDTFVYEGKGGVLSDIELIHAVQLLRPTHLIVPDIPSDANGTIANFRHLMNKWSMFELPDALYARTKMVGVIQGRNIAEMVRCARIMGDLTDWLAVPTRMPLDAPRSKLLDALLNDTKQFDHHSFHLLGQGQQGFEDDVRCANFPQVKSLDSKKAVSAALQGIDLETLMHVAQGVQETIREQQGNPTAQARIIVHSDDDFFERRLTDEQLELARKNAATIQSWLR